MKPLFFLLIALLSHSALSFAADSRCLLGDNGKIAMTTFEHRTGADQRATDITLIIGPHLLQGQLKNQDFGPITLREVGAPATAKYQFTGKIKVNYRTYQVKLQGKLRYDDKNSRRVDADFKCRILEP